jgi:hypothetical protein
VAAHIGEGIARHGSNGLRKLWVVRRLWIRSGVIQ